MYSYPDACPVCRVCRGWPSARSYRQTPCFRIAARVVPHKLLPNKSCAKQFCPTSRRHVAIERHGESIPLPYNDSHPMPASSSPPSMHKVLAAKQPTVKFLRLRSSAAEGGDYDPVALPTLLLYKAGEVVGCMTRVTDDIGENFTQEDVEWLLQEHDVFEVGGVELHLGTVEHAFALKSFVFGFWVEHVLFVNR